MVDYQGRIVIIGLGVTGLSCINFFLTRGVIPYVMDTNVTPPGLNNLSKEVKCHLGSLNDNWILSADLIIISPGVALTNYSSLNTAMNLGVEIISDIELFCREAQAPIIAITGSNGKSTVTSLVGEMAKASGINVGVGGNIGIPALMLLDPSKELYVLEISSFQLETTYNLQAYAATILNITEDHKDRYPFGLNQYRSAKLRIYNNAKTCVINVDDALTIPSLDMNRRCISFGANTGDYHLNYQHGETWLCVHGQNVLSTREISLFGKHNHINGLVALALADIAGLPREFSLKTLSTFSGLRHRFQLVLERNGVRWINDSKATNVGSTKVALDNLYDVDGILHLLLGGDSKAADFSPLIPWFTEDKMQLYCFGRDREKLSILNPRITKQTETLEEAMYLLSRRVKSGDVVLLSPACASLDQFKNFEQRGSLFVRLAKELG